MKNDSVMVFCAHNDDQILGAGGTLAQYAKQGRKIYIVIFAYGKGSHPWLKDEAITDIRQKECVESDKVLGVTESIYMGFQDNLQSQIKERSARKKILELIRKKKPSKIFTHSKDDPHPDHKVVHQLITALVADQKIKSEVYTFDVWNPLNFRERENPRLVVDTSKTFSVKMDAIRCHRSQRMAIYTLVWNVIWKDFFNGLKNHHRFAEVFYRVH